MSPPEDWEGMTDDPRDEDHALAAGTIADLALLAGIDEFPKSRRKAERFARETLAGCVEVLSRLAYERRRQLLTALHGGETGDELRAAHRDATALFHRIGITVRDL